MTPANRRDGGQDIIRSYHQAQTNALVAQWIEVGKKVNLKE